MVRLPRAVVGDAYSNQHAWGVLEDLTAIGNRMCGQDGEREAARVMEAAFERIGAHEVQTTRFDVPGWWRGRCSLAVDSPHARTFEQSHEIIALPGTPPADVEAEVVDVGYGLPREFDEVDVAGKLVLASSWVPEDYGRWVHRQEKYGRAADEGAAGFLFRSHTPGGLPPTGFVSFAGSEASIPGAGVSFETGSRLSRYCEEGLTATLSIECEKDETTSQNVEAVVGPATEDEVVVGAHVDAHDISEGAGDDGCGSAILTEVGRLLVAAGDELETRVRLVSFGGEEPGMYGSDHWAATNDLERVRCAINLDGIGDSRTPRLYDEGFAGLEEAFAEACAEVNSPYTTDHSIHAHGDQWSFVKRGVTAGMVGSGAAGRAANAHTHVDTIDKLDRRDVRDLAIVVAEAVLKLAERDRELPESTAEDVRDRIDDETKLGLERQGRWPFDS